MLQRINGHDDLLLLSDRERTQLCAEIREFLISHVSKTGGHLAGNLGAVELSVAIETVFDTMKDRLVFDVGHQCYTHKLLTGRYEKFDTNIEDFLTNNNIEFARTDKSGTLTFITNGKTIKKIEDLKRRLSYIEFQDRLSSEDYKRIDELEAEIKQLQQGNQITIMNIKAKGPDGREIQLRSLPIELR